MRSTQQLSITLPNEMADLVRAKVASGEYASESEVIRDGLRTLLARDRAVEDWLRDKVAPAYDALIADPTRAVSVDLYAQHYWPSTGKPPPRSGDARHCLHSRGRSTTHRALRLHRFRSISRDCCTVHRWHPDILRKPTDFSCARHTARRYPARSTNYELSKARGHRLSCKCQPGKHNRNLLRRSGLRNGLAGR